MFSSKPFSVYVIWWFYNKIWENINAFDTMPYVWNNTVSTRLVSSLSPARWCNSTPSHSLTPNTSRFSGAPSICTQISHSLSSVCVVFFVQFANWLQLSHRSSLLCRKQTKHFSLMVFQSRTLYITQKSINTYIHTIRTLSQPASNDKNT